MKIKKGLLSIMLTLTAALSITACLLFGAVVYDTFTFGRVTSMLAKNEVYYSVTSVEGLEELLSKLLRERDYEQIRLNSVSYGYEYYIATAQGSPVDRSDNWYTALIHAETVHVLTSNRGNTHLIMKAIYPETLPQNETSRVLELWEALRRHETGCIIGLLFSVALFGFSIWGFMRNATLRYKAILLLLVLGIIQILEVWLLKAPRPVLMTALILAEKGFLCGIVVYWLNKLEEIHRRVRRISNPEEAVREKIHLPRSLRPLAEDVNRAKESIEVAVVERLKSDRLKTELISNVSHDLKTPLTSIINFSDLIEKELTGRESEAGKTMEVGENTETEKNAEVGKCTETEKTTEVGKCTEAEKNILTYAQHLHRQSIRLRDLMDALIEASKASSGAIDIELIPCKVQTLLEQCVVEYDDKLKKRDITMVDIPCTEQLYILADVKALCRVFENLLNNICKYALAGSRAYIEVRKTGDRVSICFKNVSAEAINMSADELTERFVRGDASRHSEGNGLGLSIVKSLMDLMQGELQIQAEYDLFEVTLVFPEYFPEKETEAQSETRVW